MITFFLATFNGQVKLAQFLIESNANIDGKIFYKHDPLASEICEADNCYFWAKAIKDDIDRVNVLNALMERQETVKYFANDEEDISIPVVIKLLFYAQTGNIQEFQKCQAMYQLELKDIFTPKGVTPLSKAIKFNQEKFVQFLAETNPDYLRANNFNPLLYASKNNQWGIVYNFLTSPVTKNLWIPDEIRRIDINAKDAKKLHNSNPIVQANLTIITNIIEWIASHNNNSGISSDIGSGSASQEVGEKRKRELEKVEQQIALSKSGDESEPKQARPSNSVPSPFWSQSGNKMSIGFLNNDQNENPIEESKDLSLTSSTQVVDKNENESDMDIDKPGPG